MRFRGSLLALGLSSFVVTSLVGCEIPKTLSQLTIPSPTPSAADPIGFDIPGTGDDLLLIELDVDYDAVPDLGSEEIHLVYPGGAPQFSTSQYIFIKFGPSGCVDCSPFETDVSDFYYDDFPDPLVYDYIVTAPMLGNIISFFMVVVQNNPLPGDPQIVGYTNIKHIAPSNPPSGDFPYPIMFITAVPYPNTDNGMFLPQANHSSDQSTSPRGGDLWIRYTDGNIRNLTQEAGYGNSGTQNSNSIAVRDPFVHWDGDKAVFSMVHGSVNYCPGTITILEPDCDRYVYQLYEITNFGQNDSGPPVITKVQGQPDNFNNTNPIYTADDDIIFSSDHVQEGHEHHYPLLDEYEREPTNAGLFLLDTNNDTFRRVDDSPSGTNFVMIDSFGRVLYTRWDHLEREQDNVSGATHNPRNYPNEEADQYSSSVSGYDQDVFPEISNTGQHDFVSGSVWDTPHTFERFFIWMMNPDGRELETINHFGRQETTGYIGASTAFGSEESHHGGDIPSGMKAVSNMFQISEDIHTPGVYYFTDAPRTDTHAAGQILEMVAPPGFDATTQMQINDVTHPDTDSPTSSPSSQHSGFYRDPLRLSSGMMISAWTSNTDYEGNTGSDTHPQSKFDFRLVEINESGSYATAGAFITPQITKSVSQQGQSQKNWGTQGPVWHYNGPLWQLQPREVRPRQRPPIPEPELQAPELAIFQNLNIDPEELRDWMKERDLAMVIIRNATRRDAGERQQTINLRVRGGVQAVGEPGQPIQEFTHLEVFQGDRTRGYGTNPNGRRIHATPMHDSNAIAANPPSSGGVARIPFSSDGSAALFVPAARALSWQLIDHDANLPIVRERMWVTFQPGEIRVCANCHGINSTDQVGDPAPENSPDALINVLQHWDANN